MKSSMSELSKKYQWDQTWAHPFAHTDVNLVVAELSVIQETRGEISPERVIESAKNKNSVLHKYFQWDDEKAAHKYRLIKARELIRRIEVTVISDGTPKTVRVYETISRNHMTPTTRLKHFSTLDKSNVDYIKKTFVSDLKGLKTRLERYNLSEAVGYIDLAIQAIQGENKIAKESPVITTGNKTELAAV